MTRAGALLGVIDADVLPRLATRGHRRTYAKGHVLIRQEDPSPAMYLILEGFVRVERSVPALARPLHIADVGAGEVVGEMGVISGVARSATVVALTDLVVVELSHDDTLRALAEVPDLPQVLRRVIEKRLSENESILSERLARYVHRRPLEEAAVRA
jgi:CRP-like cAMP-binding protein